MLQEFGHLTAYNTNIVGFPHLCSTLISAVFDMRSIFLVYFSIPFLRKITELSLVSVGYLCM